MLDQIVYDCQYVDCLFDSFSRILKDLQFVLNPLTNRLELLNIVGIFDQFIQLLDWHQLTFLIQQFLKELLHRVSRFRLSNYQFFRIRVD